ncbi:HsdM family class I SAM-dependent methyltransferase [Anaerotruncus colihominis]|nr:N-6 DNA methylase [Anaerotruncus colihominis]UWN74445.1 N-6 DNA methylase [Anaerotruncus colihominis]
MTWHLNPKRNSGIKNRLHIIDKPGKIVVFDNNVQIIKYSQTLRTDENPMRTPTPEEYVHALAVCMLCGTKYKYQLENLYHEQYFVHGSKGSLSDEVDLMIYDEDGLSYALWEFKAYDKFDSNEEDAIRFQLFGTATLANSPKLLVYATIRPEGDQPKFLLKCIDLAQYKTYESWVDVGRPFTDTFPSDYQDINYKPYTSGGERDLKTDCMQANFRAVAATFHNEFFGEHPDNSLFINLVKCLLAKIFDERTTKSDKEYNFQIFYRNGKPETAEKIFENVNSLYKKAYVRYIDQTASIPDEIDPKEFSKEKVKAVVAALEGMSITKGAALYGDIIGAFFEEILRVGFKQDKGMYFTHSNIVRFMVEAIGLESLTQDTWKKSTHPENRLPYVIDPACGSGTFLLHAMQTITRAIKSKKLDLVNDFESIQFYDARMSDAVPNYWAENFVYGFDPQFIMAITAKVNMVLHGDGSAHIFKYDAFKPLTSYSDPKLRPAGERIRTIASKAYPHNVCETFDVVLSNPPFGVTLSPEVTRDIKNTFSLSSSQPSEGLFVERYFQLLKPGGRLGLVLPESIFNAVDLLPVRILLYRFFKIKALVALPRNVFIDTPTLTSLLFAQKKNKSELLQWDKEWDKHYGFALEKIKRAKNLISVKSKSKFKSSLQLRNAILKE